MPGEWDWEALSRAVCGGRAHRELSQAQVAARGRFSVSTLRKVENGTWRTQSPYGTLAALDRGLRWEHRSAERILFGEQEDPILIPDPPDPRLARIVNAFPGLTDHWQDVLAEIAEALPQRRA